MDILTDNGITDCFAVVGGGAMHLDNALLKCTKMRKTFCHHEQTCAMAADAYARYSGRMAAVCVTSGPGATNTLTGVVGAWQDSIPLIVISGQVRYEISVAKSGLDLRYRGIQEYQIVPAVKHMTKYAVMITDPLTIKKEMEKAISIAMDGRRGSVWVDVPADIQSAIIETEDLLSLGENILEKPSPSEDDFIELEKSLLKSKRPCILAGNGIIGSGLRDEFEQFVNNVKIPVIGGAWVGDNLYTDHPLYYRTSGNVGPRPGNFILQNADLIIVLGNSIGFRQTGFNQETFAPNAKIITVEVDINEVKKPGLHIDYHIHTSLKEFFDKVRERDIKSGNISKWVDYCDMLKERFAPYEPIKNLDMSERVCSYYFWRVFEEFGSDDYIIAMGNNSANTAKLQIGVKTRSQRILTNYACGSMGFEIPAAIGAAISSGKRVYCVTGDGSIMMNLQDLQTIKGYDLPINVIVFSNDGYNAIRQTSKNFFNGEYIGCTADTGVTFPDFEDIAKAFGFEHRVCKSNGELPGSLKWFTEMGSRKFLTIHQRLDDPVMPRLMSRMDENGNMLTPSLEDMYPFLSNKDMEELMIGR